MIQTVFFGKRQVALTTFGVDSSCGCQKFPLRHRDGFLILYTVTSWFLLGLNQCQLLAVSFNGLVWVHPKSPWLPTVGESAAIFRKGPICLNWKIFQFVLLKVKLLHL